LAGRAGSDKPHTTVKAETLAIVDRMLVGVGDEVARGDLMARLRSKQLIAGVEKNRQELTHAAAHARQQKNDYERYRLLHEQKTVTDSEFHRCRTELERAEKRLQEAEDRFKRLTGFQAKLMVHSPVSGRVVGLYVRAGQSVYPSRPLFIVEHAPDETSAGDAADKPAVVKPSDEPDSAAATQAREGAARDEIPVPATVKLQLRLAVKLFKATHGDVPQTQEQFMEKVIRANGIELPELPKGHEYVWVPDREELTISRRNE
jgi:multidrug efflux pump subunit AcrA (membrane-fusion protein)